MITITSTEAQNRFGEMLDTAQREPVTITRRGRPLAFIISPDELRKLFSSQTRRDEAVATYAAYRDKVKVNPLANQLSDDDINQLVHELR
ncbi:MAG: type II toxin-antitoxin system Phd/YefM family antitoxin [Gallionella sp.]